MFNQVFRINYSHIYYKINTVRYIMKHIFIWYLYNIIVFDRFF
jgi:hypothetical protein